MLFLVLLASVRSYQGQDRTKLYTGIHTPEPTEKSRNIAQTRTKRYVDS